MKTTIMKKYFKIATDWYFSLTARELAKHSQETQDDLMNLGELREICLPKQVLDIQK